MKIYLTKSQALETYKITATELDKLIDQGRVDVVLVQNGDEQIALYDDDLAAYVAERDITPDKFNHLRGKLLGITEAGLKYGIAPAVVSGWIKRGLIDVRQIEGQKKLIDEAEIAYIVELGRAKKMRPGKKVFD